VRKGSPLQDHLDGEGNGGRCENNGIDRQELSPQEANCGRGRSRFPKGTPEEEARQEKEEFVGEIAAGKHAPMQMEHRHHQRKDKLQDIYFGYVLSCGMCHCELPVNFDTKRRQTAKRNRLQPGLWLFCLQTGF